MFWSTKNTNHNHNYHHNSHHGSSTTSSSGGVLSEQNKNSSLSNQHLNKFDQLMLSSGSNNTNKKTSIDSHLPVPLNQANRSNSLHYVSSSSAAGSTTSTHPNAANSISNSKMNEMTASLASSTLKPFYNRLKNKTHHLFGARLEKICGPYSPENNRLPPAIMVERFSIFLK